MHIPMEFLSPQTAKTDSGAGAKASRSSQNKESGRFGQVFEKELGRHDQKMLNQQKAPKDVRENSGTVRKAEDTAAERTFHRKTHPEDDKEAVIAAGVRGLDIRDILGQSQEQEFVSILEGEESVTAPLLRVDTTNIEVQPQEIQQDIQVAAQNESEIKNVNTKEYVIADVNVNNSEKAVTDENANRYINANENVNVKETTEADSEKNALNAKHPETAEIKDTGTAIKDEVTKTEKAEVTGEVTARKPEAQSEQAGTNGQSDSSQKDKGNPSPLENKNEAAQAERHTRQSDTTQETDEVTSAVKTATVKAKNESAQSEEGKTEAVTSQPLETQQMFTQGFKAIQFRATEQLARAAYEQPVKPENLFQEMISKVETMTSESKSTMTIQLNPEYLGKVALEVALDASGIHVKIKAEDNNIRNMINTQLTSLVESLETKGFAVSEVEVVFAGANFDSGFSETGDDQRESSKNKPGDKRNVDTKGTIEYYTAVTGLMDYYLDAGISSVEYRA